MIRNHLLPKYFFIRFEFLFFKLIKKQIRRSRLEISIKWTYLLKKIKMFFSKEKNIYDNNEVTILFTKKKKLSHMTEFEEISF